DPDLVPGPPLDALRLRAGHVEAMREVVCGNGHVDALAQPGQRHPDQHQKLSRNRRSFCANRRISGVPEITIARRSIPPPNARPSYWWRMLSSIASVAS